MLRKSLRFSHFQRSHVGVKHQRTFFLMNIQFKAKRTSRISLLFGKFITKINCSTIDLKLLFFIADSLLSSGLEKNIFGWLLEFISLSFYPIILLLQKSRTQTTANEKN